MPLRLAAYSCFICAALAFSGCVATKTVVEGPVQPPEPRGEQGSAVTDLLDSGQQITNPTIHDMTKAWEFVEVEEKQAVFRNLDTMEVFRLRPGEERTAAHRGVTRTIRLNAVDREAPYAVLSMESEEVREYRLIRPPF